MIQLQLIFQVFLTRQQSIKCYDLLSTVHSVVINLKRTQTNLGRTAQTKLKKINIKVVKCNLPRNQKWIFYTPQKSLSALIEGFSDHQLRYPSMGTKILSWYFSSRLLGLLRVLKFFACDLGKERLDCNFCWLHSQYSQ